METPYRFSRVGRSQRAASPLQVVTRGHKITTTFLEGRHVSRGEYHRKKRRAALYEVRRIAPARLRSSEIHSRHPRAAAVVAASKLDSHGRPSRCVANRVHKGAGSFERTCK